MDVRGWQEAALVHHVEGQRPGKFAFLHVMTPFQKGKNHAGNSTFKWYGLSG